MEEFRRIISNDDHLLRSGLHPITSNEENQMNELNQIELVR